MIDGLEQIGELIKMCWQRERNPGGGTTLKELIRVRIRVNIDKLNVTKMVIAEMQSSQCQTLPDTATPPKWVQYHMVLTFDRPYLYLYTPRAGNHGENHNHEIHYMLVEPTERHPSMVGHKSMQSPLVPPRWGLDIVKILSMTTLVT